MGEYTSMKDVVDDAAKSGAEILTFRSTRAAPIQYYMQWVYLQITFSVSGFLIVIRYALHADPFMIIRIVAMH